MKTCTVCLLAWSSCVLVPWAGSAVAGTTFYLSIDGPDAIFLAGRTDVVIPEPGEPWDTGTFLGRHPFPTPEETKEQVPDFIPVTGGAVVKVLDAAIGGVNFFLGFGPDFFGPSGNGAEGSSLLSVDGISGYLGPQGPLTGVFLSDAIPSAGPAPATLDFTPAGLGLDFATLSPELGQVFYIGDGITSGGIFQAFTAPIGATRMFFGIPDGFGFGGPPGAYDDNDGAYRIIVGVDEDPIIPEPTTAGLVAAAGLVGLMRRPRSGR